MVDKLATTSVEFGWVAAFLFLIYDIFHLLLILITCKFIYQDLYTEERQSVQQRRKAPDITPSYKLMAYLTLFSSIFFWLSNVNMFLLYFSSTDFSCYLQQVFAGSNYQIGKALMYLLFLLRLYTIYKPSQYAYSKKSIVISAIWMILFLIAIISVMAIRWVSGNYHYSNGPSFPNYCDATLEPLSAGMIMIEDIIVSTAFLMAFFIPLKKTIKAAKAVSSIADSKALYKIQYAGTKTVILTAVTMVSTFVIMVATTLTNLNPIVGIDAVINSICILFMLPYFPDNLYYQKYCICCIFCCDKRHLSYEHNEKQLAEEMKKKEEPEIDDIEPTVTVVSATNTNATDVSSIQSSTQNEQSSKISVSPTSVDTMDQLPHTAAKTNVADNDKVYGKIEQQN